MANVGIKGVVIDTKRSIAILPAIVFRKLILQSTPVHSLKEKSETELVKEGLKKYKAWSPKLTRSFLKQEYPQIYRKYYKS